MHLLPGLDVLLGSQLLIPIKFCHGKLWQIWRITMFFTYSEMFWKARCPVVNFLLLVNMHIACPVFDWNDIWSIFRGNHWLDQIFSLSWNSSSILWSLKHPGFPCLNCDSVLLICWIRALPYTFRDAPNSTQPTSACDYQSCISVSSITQTTQLVILSRQKTIWWYLYSSQISWQRDGPGKMDLFSNTTSKKRCNRTSSFLGGKWQPYTKDGPVSEECWLNSVPVFQMST